MTRKHFKVLAAAIAEIENETTRKEVAFKIGSVCNESNNLFNWKVWYAACNCKANYEKANS